MSALEEINKKYIEETLRLKEKVENVKNESEELIAYKSK